MNYPYIIQKKQSTEARNPPVRLIVIDRDDKGPYDRYLTSHVGTGKIQWLTSDNLLANYEFVGFYRLPVEVKQ